MDLSRTFAIQNPHMPAVPQSNIHLDILEGRDETLDVTDFFRMFSLHPVPLPVADLLLISRLPNRPTYGYPCRYGAKAADVILMGCVTNRW
jgi:Proteasome maturation factor UMP1